MPDLAAARRSLRGLALGDAYGQRHFRNAPATIDQFEPGPWRWTDDTHMALSIVEVLEDHESIDQDALAVAFARRFAENPFRGYAGGAARLLTAIVQGGDWRALAPQVFPGGSFGNGGAMRVAPVGAYFSGDPARAASEGARSAEVTHSHPEGRAGAIAVAVAASLLPGMRRARAGEWLDACLDFIPEGATRDGIVAARSIPEGEHELAARRLGSGYEVSAQDTVPFCLWMVAHERDFERALWLTLQGGGDCDTTCAIVGGILGVIHDSLPPAWVERAEVLPA